MKTTKFELPDDLEVKAFMRTDSKFAQTLETINLDPKPKKTNKNMLQTIEIVRETFQGMSSHKKPPQNHIFKIPKNPEIPKRENHRYSTNSTEEGTATINHLTATKKPNMTRNFDTPEDQKLLKSRNFSSGRGSSFEESMRALLKGKSAADTVKKIVDSQISEIDIKEEECPENDQEEKMNSASPMSPHKPRPSYQNGGGQKQIQILQMKPREFGVNLARYQKYTVKQNGQVQYCKESEVFERVVEDCRVGKKDEIDYIVSQFSTQ